MFNEYFGLESRPFTKTPDPRFLYLSKTHEEALARLMYAVEERELIVLTGEVGCGKTTLTRALIDALPETYRIILIINPMMSPYQFLRIVARGLDLNPQLEQKDELLDAIYSRVFEDYERGVTPVIIIDESQLIPKKETFEEIRLLTNFQLDDVNMLSLVIVGQTELRARLSADHYNAFRQRIGLFYHVGPLTREETRAYVTHRLGVAGRQGVLFTDEALNALYDYSEGVPRLINTICSIAMLEGISREAELIEVELVDSAAAEIAIDALPVYGQIVKKEEPQVPARPRSQIKNPFGL